MGIYLNPGKENFQTVVNSEIFVDKTEMLGFLNSVVNTMQKYVSVSRPRRFGKTMAADMICAYYDREADSRALFEQRKIAGCPPITAGGGRVLTWDAFLGSFDVLHLTMTRFFKRGVSVEKSLARMQRTVVRDIKSTYPDVDYFDEDDLLATTDDVCSQTGRQLVVVIDEWDALFRERQEDREGQREYLDFLRDWLKDNKFIALAYMTGILPIKKCGRHSALNMLTEYSMMYPMQLAKYTAFTEDEVTRECRRRGRDFESMRRWYDGYEVADIVPPNPDYGESSKAEGLQMAKRYSLYSPLSVVKAVTTGAISNYWNKTETYEALAGYIRMDYDGLKEAVALLMDGGRVAVDTSTYQNDMTTFHGRNDVLSLLVHLGYLGFDDRTGEVFVPNREVLDEFRASTKSGEWAGTLRAFEASKELLAVTWALDAGRVAELLEVAHDRAANRTYNDEAALSYAVQYAYYAAQRYYTTILELDSGKGYADVAYLHAPGHQDKPALLVEFKFGDTAEGTIAQIRRRNYPQRLEHYRGNLLLVGVNYDRDVPAGKPGFKRHNCIIEGA